MTRHILDRRHKIKKSYCILKANTCSGSGGGMYLHPVSTLVTELTNCTITDNQANSFGGVYPGPFSVIRNSILYGNTAATTPNVRNVYEDYKVHITCSDIEECGDSGVYWDKDFGVDGGGNIEGDPDFNSSSPSGLELLSTSPCIDRGDNAIIHEAGDITGWYRTLDGDNDGQSIVDMGAYEYGFTPSCGQVQILDVSYSQNGITDPENYGWQNQCLTAICGESYVISDTFKVEDSEGCGSGTNSNTQSGTCDIWIYLPSAKTVTLAIVGNVEMVDSDKDVGEIYVDEAASHEVRIEGTDTIYETCNMEQKDDDATITLGQGTHHIQFNADTVDELWHQDAYFTFSVTISNP